MLKRPLNIIFILLLFSSFQQQDENHCITEIFKTVDKQSSKKYHKVVTINEFGLRHSIDSLNYNIIRRWTEKGGKAIIESIENEFANIEYWRGFYENGNIKEEGFMTSSYSTRIGVWKFYSEDNKSVKKYDYESDRKISFCKLYRICSDKKLLDASCSFRLEPGMWIINKSIGSNKECLIKSIILNTETETFSEKISTCYY